MSSALLAEHRRIVAELERSVAGLGVLAAAPLTRVVADLRALGEDWEAALDQQTGLLEEANAAMDARGEEAA